MDRFDTLQLFTRIVELRSFSKAAAALEIPRATATHAIKSLEARLNSRLLDRTTRQVSPTVDGMAFYRRCISVLGELEDAESSLQYSASNPVGVLRVDMHNTHATKIVIPRIDDFRSLYPEIELVISGGDRLIDLVKEGVDCVIRAGHPQDSSLVARRLALMPQIVCASNEYINRNGKPAHPNELNKHHCVKFFTSSGHPDYPFEFIVDNQINEIRPKGWVSVNDAENYVACALSGSGLIQLPRFHVENYLKTGELVEVLQKWPSPSLPVSVLYPYHRHLSSRVRVFIDWLADVYEGEFSKTKI